MDAPKRKDDVIYIEHMLTCIKRINEYTEGSKEKFFASPLVQDGVVRNLQVLAESSQQISEELKNIHTDVAWRDISGFRNILVHDYLGVDPDIVWSVVEQDIPVLYRMLKNML